MEDLQKQKSIINWKKIKQVVFSKDKLKALSEMDIVDLNLFKKKFTNKNVVSTCSSNNDNCKIGSVITYTGISNDLTKFLNFNNDFKEIVITKPIDNSTSNDDLSKFNEEKIDNTGNIQLWPCEEILSIYCLKNQERFKNKRVIELGSGYSGLCGLIMAALIPSITEMMITDGNSKSVEALNFNISENFSENTIIQSKVLLWEEDLPNETNPYDFVIISDCLFFIKYHLALVKTIKSLIANSENGVCIIVSPKRGETMNNFLEKSKEYFNVQIKNDEINFIHEVSKGGKCTYSANFIELTLKK